MASAVAVPAPPPANADGTMSMFATIAGIVLGGLLSVVPQDPKPGDPKPGIDAELAAARRARVSDVHYDLAFVLDRGMTSVAGTAALRFTLGDDARERPLILDFAGEALTDVVVNGTTDVALPRVGNHVVVPGDLLRPGTNTFTAKMRSRVAATGTPLSHDRDDASGEDFYYTLLVPADAHGLFPCFDQPDLKARFALSIEAPADWHVVANTDGTSRDVDGMVEVEVRDRGHGIPDPERIFDAFYTTKKEGMGMGLAICRSIIEAHEGRIGATSTPGEGSTVGFTLPALSQLDARIRE